MEVLGNDLPKFASFYVSFILLKALADVPRTLLQVNGLIQFAARFGQGPNVKFMYRSLRGKDEPAGASAAQQGAFNAVPVLTESYCEPPLTPFADESPVPVEADSKASPATGGAPMLAHASSSASVTPAATVTPPSDPSIAAEQPQLMAKARKFHISPRQFVNLVVNGGGAFNYPAAITDVLFVILIGFIFGAMVPILPPLIALTMAIMGMVYKYQLVYRTQRSPDSGAAFTPAIINRLAFALGLMQAVVAAMLFVRENPAAGAVTLLPLIVTRLFIGTVNTRILSTADLLSLREAVEGDAAHGRMGPPPAVTGTPPSAVAATDEESGGAAEAQAATSTGAADEDAEDDEHASDRDAAVVAEFVGEVLATHAYVPASVMPTRDLQPGVVVLPPTVEVPEESDDDNDDDDDEGGLVEGDRESSPVGSGAWKATAVPAGDAGEAEAADQGQVAAGDVHPEQRTGADAV